MQKQPCLKSARLRNIEVAGAPIHIRPILTENLGAEASVLLLSEKAEHHPIKFYNDARDAFLLTAAYLMGRPRERESVEGARIELGERGVAGMRRIEAGGVHVNIASLYQARARNLYAFKNGHLSMLKP